MIGNSSSGIREAHFFNVPVVNIGTRQSGRERTDNIIDVGYNKISIKRAILNTLEVERSFKEKKIYGDGSAGQRIAEILSKINLEFIIQKTLQVSL